MVIRGSGDNVPDIHNRPHPNKITALLFYEKLRKIDTKKIKFVRNDE